MAWLQQTKHTKP